MYLEATCRERCRERAENKRVRCALVALGLFARAAAKPSSSIPPCDVGDADESSGRHPLPSDAIGPPRAYVFALQVGSASLTDRTGGSPYTSEVYFAAVNPSDG